MTETRYELTISGEADVVPGPAKRFRRTLLECDAEGLEVDDRVRSAIEAAYGRQED